VPPDWVVVRLDILEDIGLGFFEGLVAATVDLLDFQLEEETLHGGVVVAIAFAPSRTLRDSPSIFSTVPKLPLYTPLGLSLARNCSRSP